MDERDDAVMTHVLGILTFFVGPLIYYFMKRRKASPWLRDHLDESVNYNILVIIAFVLCIVVALVLTNFGQPMLALLMAFVAVALWPLKLILEIIAAVKAKRGKPFHFPLDIKMIR